MKTKILILATALLLTNNASANTIYDNSIDSNKTLATSCYALPGGIPPMNVCPPVCIGYEPWCPPVPTPTIPRILPWLSPWGSTYNA